MSKLNIDTSRCKGCGYCVEVCPPKALSFAEGINTKGYTTVVVNDELCTRCGACYRVCPDYALEIY